jgi:DNA helicase II / ATP-dependent DNA helicase PcrA
MPTGIEIIEADIELIEKELKLRLDDAERIAVLKEVKSCDVQAGPGSGKTTILIAKLAILSRKWPSRDRGICVLSHTNVARKEIEQKLNLSPELRRLLHYPHFIGTIQTFVDQFLAIPFLRRERVEVTAIDNERFGARAWSMFCRTSPKGRFAIVNYCQKDVKRAQSIVGSLRLDGAHMGVTHSMVGAKRFPGESSETGQALISVKESLRAEGYFRYDDMFAFAEACLFKVPYVAPALRRRFPWVFIDELQDTSKMQDSVIEQIFGADGCIFQRFGDKNQAIFDFDSDSDGGQSLFGRRNILFLNGTHRFGKSIAAFASQLTAVERQALVGNPGLPDLEHTVFVFDRAAVDRVVPSFGNLVLKIVPPEILTQRSVCVVGNRVNPANHAKDNFPAFLGDYGDYYVSPRSAKPETPDTFLGYIVEARKKWAETGTGAEPYNLAISGVLALLRRNAHPGEAEAVPRTKTTLHKAMMQSGGFNPFQKLIWQLLNPVNQLDEQKWTACIKEILPLFGIAKPLQDASNFLAWENCAGAMPAREAKSAIRTEGIYLHRVGEISLPIRYDSIHAVKGETHAATMVVETFARQHDLKELLPVLTAAQHGSQMRDSARGHCKRVFVGMSRPSHLLCLAISAEHITNAQITALAANGWKIQKVRA